MGVGVKKNMSRGSVLLFIITKNEIFEDLIMDKIFKYIDYNTLYSLNVYDRYYAIILLVFK
tara:strand:+ start:635 stop:817 length:183 start_codon:yes stop_codon:yes gene_type:complete